MRRVLVSPAILLAGWLSACGGDPSPGAPDVGGQGGAPSSSGGGGGASGTGGAPGLGGAAGSGNHDSGVGGSGTGGSPGGSPGGGGGNPGGRGGGGGTAPPGRLDAGIPVRDAGAAGTDGGGAEDDLAFCVAENNRYRVMLSGRTALTRSSALEMFAATGAQTDTMAKTAHKHFTDTRGGGVAFAENEIPGWGGWSLSRQGSVHNIIAGGLKQMWAEGPGGGHYENMSGTRYTQIGCGVFVSGDQVTVTVDFR